MTKTADEYKFGAGNWCKGSDYELLKLNNQFINHNAYHEGLISQFSIDLELSSNLENDYSIYLATIINIIHTIDKQLIKYKESDIYSFNLAYSYIHRSKKNKSLKRQVESEFQELKSSNPDKSSITMLILKHFRFIDLLRKDRNLSEVCYSIYSDDKLNNLKYLKHSVNVLRGLLSMYNHSLAPEHERVTNYDLKVNCNSCGHPHYVMYNSNHNFSIAHRYSKYKKYFKELTQALHFHLEVNPEYDYSFLTLKPRNITNPTSDDIKDMNKAFCNFFRDRQIKKYIFGYVGVQEVKFYHKGSVRKNSHTRDDDEINAHQHFIVMFPKGVITKDNYKEIEKLFQDKYSHFCDKTQNPKLDYEFKDRTKCLQLDVRNEGQEIEGAFHYMVGYASKGVEINDPSGLKKVLLSYSNIKFLVSGRLLKKSLVKEAAAKYRLSQRLETPNELEPLSNLELQCQSIVKSFIPTQIVNNQNTLNDLINSRLEYKWANKGSKPTLSLEYKSMSNDIDNTKSNINSLKDNYQKELILINSLINFYDNEDSLHCDNCDSSSFVLDDGSIYVEDVVNDVEDNLGVDIIDIDEYLL